MWSRQSRLDLTQVCGSPGKQLSGRMSGPHLDKGQRGWEEEREGIVVLGSQITQRCKDECITFIQFLRRLTTSKRCGSSSRRLS